MFLFACSKEETLKNRSIQQTIFSERNSFVPEYIATIPQITLPTHHYQHYHFEAFVVDGLVDAANLKQGVWVITDEEKDLRYHGAYVDDKPMGWWDVFLGDKRICAGNYEQGVKQGYWGYLQIYPSTTSKYVNYVNGELDGLAREFTADSVLIADGYYKYGWKQGYWKYYYPDGTMKEQGSYHQNHKSGWWQYFDEQGQLYGEANYSQGEISGSVKRYKNGVLSEEGEQYNKKRKGIWKFYDVNGQQESIIEYED